MTDQPISLQVSLFPGHLLQQFLCHKRPPKDSFLSICSWVDSICSVKPFSDWPPPSSSKTKLLIRTTQDLEFGPSHFTYCLISFCHMLPGSRHADTHCWSLNPWVRKLEKKKHSHYCQRFITFSLYFSSNYLSLEHFGIFFCNLPISLTILTLEGSCRHLIAICFTLANGKKSNQFHEK